MLLSAVVLTMTVGILFCWKACQLPGFYGWRAPTGFGWLIAFPAALIGAVTDGAWAPGSLAYRMGPDNVYEFTGLAALLLPLGAELLFRGAILGHLVARLPIQKSAGLWWRSWPTLISTALYAGATLVLFLSFSRGQIQISQCFLIVGGALIFGIASGARTFGEHPCFCPASLGLRGGIITVQPFAVLIGIPTTYNPPLSVQASKVTIFLPWREPR